MWGQAFVFLYLARLSSESPAGRREGRVIICTPRGFQNLSSGFEVRGWFAGLLLQARFSTCTVPVDFSGPCYLGKETAVKMHTWGKFIASCDVLIYFYIWFYRCYEQFVWVLNRLAKIILNIILQTSDVNVDIDAVGRDSSVGIATCYGLDGPGIEFRWWQGFPQSSRRAMSPPNFLYNGHRVSIPGAKRPGHGVNHPLPSRYTCTPF